MKGTRASYVLLCLLGSAPVVIAQELEAEQGAFSSLDSYEHWVARELLSRDPYRYCQFVALPTLGREGAVYLTTPFVSPGFLGGGRAGVISIVGSDMLPGQPGQWTVKTVDAKEPLWKKLQETGDEGVRERAALQAAVTRASATIDQVSAERLKQAWDAMLFRVGPMPALRPEPDSGAYHFAMFREGVGYSSGVTVSPEAERSAAQDELVAMADALLARLRSEK